MSRKISQTEFVALMAMLVAIVAFSIDSMLPALPQIARELVPDDPNSAQLILGGFILGLGIGTLFTGPLSDTYGRKAVVLFGTALYVFGAVLAYFAPTIELLVAARLIQGLGAAAPRIVSIAIIRDLYSGREMARLVSFIMVIFTLVPAMAPLAGDAIMDLGGWRGIFVAFVLFGLGGSLWLGIRLEEPLATEDRREFRFRQIGVALKEMLAIPMARLGLLVQMAVFSTLFCGISMIHQIFDRTFGMAEEFPVYFFVIGVICMTSSLLNAKLVMKYGMRAILMWTAGIFLALTIGMLAAHMSSLDGAAYFWIYLIWQSSFFYQMGLTMGNLNALAMEPLGHMAGLAASVLGATSTIFGAFVGTVVTQFFDGTPLPLILSALILGGIAFWLTLRMRRLERVQTARAAKAG